MRKAGNHPSRTLVVATLLVALAGAAALYADSAEEQAAERFAEIDWQKGPAVGKLGGIAEIQVPEGFAFTGSRGAKTFLELNQNIPGGNELGILVKVGDEGLAWFAIFEFDPIGYVKDDEKDALDADAMLKSIREGTEQANEERRKHGWDTIDVVGWDQAPFYDPETKNLSWAIRGRGSDGDVVNYNTRLLGRRGVMSANLVIEPEGLAEQVPVFKGALGGFEFSSGNRYAEFRSGDKVAKYGLTALVAGGAAAVALKSGLLQKLWKLIVVAVVAIGAWLKRFFGSRRGGTDPVTTVPPMPPQGT